jgi:cytoskeleton protein RodZ
MKDTGILGVKAWRQRKGISLSSIAASTKLSVAQLEAIESGQFKRLPGGIYNTNYIRQYARAIDFDESDLIAFYNDACGAATQQATASVVPPSSSSRFSRLLFQH